MACLKRFFPYLASHEKLIYLDTAATAHKPSCVMERMDAFYRTEYGSVHRGVYQSAIASTALYEEARRVCADFLHVKAEEIIFTRGTTEAINLVARGFPFQAGDEVWISPLEHHANLIPWQMMAKEKGVVLRFLPISPAGDILPCRLSPKARLISVAHVSNVTGKMAPVAALRQEAMRVGAYLLLDGAQRAPHGAVDVPGLGADFYAFSGHKCYGPTGIGVLYGREEALSLLSPVQGGGHMVDKVELLGATYQKAPLCFEAGTPPIAEAVGLMEALSFLREHAGSEEELMPLLIEELQSIAGLKIIAAAGTICTFVIDGIHPLDIASWLDVHQIAVRSGHLCAQTALRHFGIETACRISFGLYSTAHDVKQLKMALSKIPIAR